jgi:hypothetical protein
MRKTNTAGFKYKHKVRQICRKEEIHRYLSLTRMKLTTTRTE